MKKLIILISILILTGCQQESQEQKIQNCKDMNGKPKITYCVGNSNTICRVECFMEVGESDESKRDV